MTRQLYKLYSTLMSGENISLPNRRKSQNSLLALKQKEASWRIHQEMLQCLTENEKALIRHSVTFKRNLVRWNPTKLNQELRVFSLAWDFHLKGNNSPRRRSLVVGE
jgi:hypothetical protein